MIYGIPLRVRPERVEVEVGSHSCRVERGSEPPVCSEWNTHITVICIF